MPRVTVLLPAHDAALHIGSCLECLSNQTFRDIKVLVLDDGSEDATAEIVNRHVAKDRRFELISFPKSGLVSTLKGDELSEPALYSAQSSR